MTDTPTTAERWSHIAVPAPLDATCCICGGGVVGTDYWWRPVSEVHDLALAYAHPSCVEAELQ